MKRVIISLTRPIYNYLVVFKAMKGHPNEQFGYPFPQLQQQVAAVHSQEQNGEREEGA